MTNEASRMEKGETLPNAKGQHNGRKAGVYQRANIIGEA